MVGDVQVEEEEEEEEEERAGFWRTGWWLESVLPIGFIREAYASRPENLSGTWPGGRGRCWPKQKDRIKKNRPIHEIRIISC